MNVRYEIEYLQTRVCEIMGLPSVWTSRHRKYVVARVLITRAACMKGMKETEIGNVLGKNHATINHYKTMYRLWELMPSVYGRELDYWEQLKHQI